LKSLADFYGISVDDFYLEEKKKIVSQSHSLTKQVYIKLLSVGIGWLVTLMTFFFLDALLPEGSKFQTWLNFVYGALIMGVILLVWDFIYHHRFLRMIDTSVVIWTATVSLYLTFLVILDRSLPFLFIVAAPLQVLEILWFLFRRNKKKTGTK